MKKYEVLKVVGYVYNVEANTEEEAKDMVRNYGTIEAKYWDIDYIEINEKEEKCI